MIRPYPLFLALPLLALSAPARAQATNTASRVTILSVFAEYQHLSPDYGQPADTGAILGLNYTRFFRSPIIPSFELRVDYTPKGDVVGEKSGLGGLRLALNPQALHLPTGLGPYANFLIGAGEIDFTHPAPTGRGPYSHDNSIVYNYGAGLTYRLTRSLAVQAEFQQQNWNLGGQAYSQPLTPFQFNAGLRYQIPFSARTHR